MVVRSKLKTRIDEMNKDVGYLRRDSQAHTPLSLLYTFLIAAPVPLFLGLLAAGLWVQPGTFTSVMGAAVAQIALLWLVFEVLYRLLKTNGIAQRHFRWSMEYNHQMRRRLLVTGLAPSPLPSWWRLVTSGQHSSVMTGSDW